MSAVLACHTATGKVYVIRSMGRLYTSVKENFSYGGSGPESNVCWDSESLFSVYEDVPWFAGTVLTSSQKAVRPSEVLSTLTDWLP